MAGSFSTSLVRDEWQTGPVVSVPFALASHPADWRSRQAHLADFQKFPDRLSPPWDFLSDERDRGTGKYSPTPRDAGILNG